MNKTSWIFVGVTFIICAGISFFFIRPAVSSSWTTYKETQTAKKDLENISKRKDILNELTKNTQLNTLYDTASTYIPEEANSGALIIELTAIANNAKMQVEQVSLESNNASATPQEDSSANTQSQAPAASASGNNIQEVPFTMKLSGTFADFQKFLQNTETSSRLITISGMTLSQNDTAFTASITGKTYWKKGSTLESNLNNIQISQATIDLFKNLKTYGLPINLPSESGFGRTDPFATF